jgi:crooked neck
MFAHFEVRQNQLTIARKLLGQAIGMCPKDKLFKGYIELEMKLFEFNRCRQLYTKYIEWNGSNCQTWIKFAELERGLDDLDRARAIFELAVEEPQLDMPELLWKAYIDFEEGEGEYDRTRALYERLLQKTDHVKVWTSWAQFELSVPDDADENGTTAEDEDRPVSEAAKSRAREIFTRAHTRLKGLSLTTDRVALLTAWRSFEAIHGSPEDQGKIEKQMPRKVKKRRKLDDGEFEEYVDYVFPADDESAAKLAKLMANAQKWKAAQAAKEAENGE